MTSPRAGTLQEHLQAVDQAITKLRGIAGKIEIEGTVEGGDTAHSYTISLEKHLNAIEQIVKQITILAATGALQASKLQKLATTTLRQLVQNKVYKGVGGEMPMLMVSVTSKSKDGKKQEWKVADYQPGTAEQSLPEEYDEQVTALQKALFALNAYLLKPNPTPETADDTTDKKSENQQIDPQYFAPPYVGLYKDRGVWLTAGGTSLSLPSTSMRLQKNKRFTQELTNFLDGVGTDDIGMSTAGAPAEAAAETNRTIAVSTTERGTSLHENFYPLRGRTQYASVEIPYFAPVSKGMRGLFEGWVSTKTANQPVNERVLFVANRRANGQVGLMMAPLPDGFARMLKNKDQKLQNELAKILSGADTRYISNELRSIMRIALAEYHALKVMYEQSVVEAKRKGDVSAPEFFMRQPLANSTALSQMILVLAQADGLPINLNGMKDNKPMQAKLKKFSEDLEQDPKHIANLAACINNPVHGFETTMLVKYTDELPDQLLQSMNVESLVTASPVSLASMGAGSEGKEEEEDDEAERTPAAEAAQALMQALKAEDSTENIRAQVAEAAIPIPAPLTTQHAMRQAASNLVNDVGAADSAGSIRGALQAQLDATPEMAGWTISVDLGTALRTHISAINVQIRSALPIDVPDLLQTLKANINPAPGGTGGGDEHAQTRHKLEVIAAAFGGIASAIADQAEAQPRQTTLGQICTTIATAAKQQADELPRTLHPLLR